MIIYQATKEGFLNDILTNDIENIVQKDLLNKANKRVGASELNSYKNSLMYMSTVLQDPEIPSDCNVAIEYHIPQTSKRLDFILTGQGYHKEDYAILIELKQWSSITLTNKDSIVKTEFKGGVKETAHPSYQAWSYAALLNGFNQTVMKIIFNYCPVLICIIM